MADGDAGSTYTPELVAYRLERAGATLLTFSSRAGPAGFRSSCPDIAQQVADGPPRTVPSARDISAMDEALGWLQLIPQADIPLRKAVGMRMLYRPETQRYVFSWRRVGQELGVSHHTAETWWLQGIYLITAALNRPLLCTTLGRQGRAMLEELRRVEARRAVVSARTRRTLAKA